MKSPFLLLALPLLMFSQLAQAAFEISPTSEQIVVKKEDKRPATRSFYVRNLGKDPVALEYKMSKRITLPDGTLKVVEIPNVDDILSVYPKQFILKEGEKRTVRVTYKGPKDLTDEIDYRFTLSNISVRTTNDKKRHVKSTMKIDVGYEGSIYIFPESAKPSIEFKKYELDSKNKAIRFQLVNNGNKHHVLREYTLNITYITNKGETKSEKIKMVHLTDEKLQQQFLKSTGGINPKQIRWYSYPFNTSDVKEIKEVKFQLND